MFKKILIANRGEIAIRIIRACKDLGIETVAVYSDIDANSLHIRFADQSVCIGPASPTRSYLSIPAIISAAELTGVDAIHPGYGFLAENSRFAEICEGNGFKFIGPSSSAMKSMGDKILAKQSMLSAGIPVVPGNHEKIENIPKAKKIAQSIGYPVIIKAALGGGGKGMRIVNNDNQLERVFPIAKEEARVSFRDGSLYIEKYLEKPRHIEVQIIADDYNSCISLGERDCSIQRRHQKLIEESPSPIVTPTMRKKIENYAKKAAQTIDYTSVGTVEFLLDKTGNFYFMEMNTRIQVEHPVTEAITGIDIVKEQIKIASGKPLSIKQKDVHLKGHAIECRINAEDPENDFKPSPGKIEHLYIPGGPGIRVDTHIYGEYIIPSSYDSLIAKVIAYADTREQAIQCMERALDEFLIEGIKTTIPFHKRIISDPRFKKGKIDTSFIQNL